MKKMTFIAVFSALVLSTCASSVKTAPAWFEKKPQIPRYILGAGYGRSPQMNAALADATAAAKLDAAKEVSEEVLGPTVKVVKDLLGGESGKFLDPYREAVVKKLRVELEGLEINESAYNDDTGEYWVLVALDREFFIESRQKKLSEARSAAVPLLAEAEGAEPVKTFNLLAYAIDVLFAKDALSVLDEKGNPLLDRIHAGVLNALKNLPLQRKTYTITGVRGRKFAFSLPVEIVGMTASREGIPVRFSFEKGGGEIEPEAATTADGKALFISKGIEAEAAVAGKIDLARLSKSGESAKVFFESFDSALPKTSINVLFRDWTAGVLFRKKIADRVDATSIEKAVSESISAGGKAVSAIPVSKPEDFFSYFDGAPSALSSLYMDGKIDVLVTGLLDVSAQKSAGGKSFDAKGALSIRVYDLTAGKLAREFEKIEVAASGASEDEAIAEIEKQAAARIPASLL